MSIASISSAITTTARPAFRTVPPANEEIADQTRAKQSMQVSARREAMAKNDALAASARSEEAGNPPKLTPAAMELAAKASPHSDLTVEGMLKAWGQSDSSYDLDGDGTVGVGDLLALLGRLNSTESQQLETQVLDLLSAWGQDGSKYDLDGDGTVGVSDLLGLLQQASGSQQPVDPEPEPSEPTLEGLLQAWGSDNAAYDFNGDGTVGVGDLLALLGQLNSTESQQLETQVLDLLSTWGQDGSKYDLDGDGTVGVSDLLALLEQASGSQQPVDPESEPSEPTLEGLMQAWGSDNAAYDFNGDGVVDVSDLLAMLSKLGASPDSGSASKEKLVASELPPGVTADGSGIKSRVGTGV